MKVQDLYEVWVQVTRPKVDHAVRAFFDHVPTIEEFVESMAHEYAGNEEYIPGITLAVIELLTRVGIPVPPPDVAPDVSSSFMYPGGWIRITRTRRFVVEQM